MIIKKFTGKTEEEATAQARKELGESIVIMNVRPLKRTGFLSFMKAQKVEVTVALEEDPRAQRTPPTVASRADLKPLKPHTTIDLKTPENIGDKVVPAEKEAPASAMAGLARAAQEGKIPPLHVSQEGKAAVRQQIRPEKDRPAREEKTAERGSVDAIEEKLDNLHSLLEQRINAPQGDTAISRLKESATGKEKETAQEPAAPAPQEKAAEPEETNEESLSFIKLLYNTLLENEVDERYANELTDEVEKLAKPNIPLDNTLANVYQKMVLKFGKTETITPSPEGAKAEIFIGPTGVGKTTTIAKLASKLYVQDKKKVALLTVDTYRIAAAEQLRTYAAIMEIPFRVIYSVEEMKQAVRDFGDYDYLMIDTAGQAIHNEEQKNNIAQFIHALSEELPCDNFLVLSATTKYRDLIDITDAYGAMMKFKLLFTKMDETAATGNLYNIRLRTGAPMSYITNGQDVPDDIEDFNAQKIVKGLLGGKKHT